MTVGGQDAIRYLYAKFGAEDRMADSLVVTSKVKKFIKEKGGCNTSTETIDILSKAVERLCQKGLDPRAIQKKLRFSALCHRPFPSAILSAMERAARES
jgi:hypothetical protein